MPVNMLTPARNVRRVSAPIASMPSDCSRGDWVSAVERQAFQRIDAVGPIAFGERNSTASSTRSACTNAAATVGPPSTISRVMPRSASSFSTATRSSRPSCACDAEHLDALGAQHLFRHRRSASAAANTQIGVSRAVATSAVASGSRSLRRARPAPASAAPCRAAGRSAADRRPAPCRCRPGSRRSWRAS